MPRGPPTRLSTAPPVSFTAHPFGTYIGQTSVSTLIFGTPRTSDSLPQVARAFRAVHNVSVRYYCDTSSRRPVKRSTDGCHQACNTTTLWTTTDVTSTRSLRLDRSRRVPRSTAAERVGRYGATAAAFTINETTAEFDRGRSKAARTFNADTSVGEGVRTK